MQNFKAVIVTVIVLVVISVPVLPSPISQGLFTKTAVQSQSSIKFNCTLCEIAVRIAEGLLKNHVPDTLIAKAILGICEEFKIEDRDVCQGVVSEFQDELFTVLTKTHLPASDVCALLFGSVCSKSGLDPHLNWTVAIPSKPPRPNDTEPIDPLPDAPKLRVLHLADLHIDLLYSPGSNAACNEPLCCRQNDGVPPDRNSAAGYWGEYGSCDLPEHTLDDMFNHLAENEEFDMIYWTGDLPPHDIWKQSRTDQVNLLQYLTKKLVTFFPGKPVFSTIGNHESAPVNSFPPPFVSGNQSESWLYQALAQTWSSWLTPDAVQTIKYGGFYTVLVKPGFRVISLNTNFCNQMNWWLLLNETDPAQQLQWLVGVLHNAEIAGEKVHILGHIPPGVGDCNPVWSRNYNRIILRYSSTVIAQFFGHTHNDHFQLFYNPETSKPINVAYIAPSVTTYSNMNPSYRLYTMDGFYVNSTWAVLDHETTILNLTYANSGNKTVWSKEYSARDAYNMPNLHANSWLNVAEALLTNDTLFNTFLSFYYKMSPNEGQCDQTCRDSLICALHMAVSGDRRYCSSKIKTSMEDMRKHFESHKHC